ncbi:2-hydroxyacid dehydrogenase [Cuniculiplasma divulgatum]|jgi:glycerate dehydrogenase|uniref:Glycerate dehydrogenase n=1 Tax=Cuniculiplasma divulgatum TaxID=1673428 RepID=A0A1N5VSG0_9ARCH|nr:2-hydroxyacid dehydrogenase [Cuniculiplasma divulgatum]MCI2412993.1 2-hydroxyacid dehydrogenase [Cuniculiplasma sp.]SIM75904.1 glycerate dehydrogenase [Cuniculiplasma divulgatum]SJK85285.1 glycerate dehydrogenase [Cuniculiplasma divulgatum]
MKLLILAKVPDDMKEVARKMAESIGMQAIFEEDGNDWSDVEALLSFIPKLRTMNSYISKLPKLKLIQTLSAGVDLLDFNQIPDNITVCSNAGAFALPVAEHAVSMAMALSKNLLSNHMKMKNGVFNQRSPSIKLEGKMAGVLGYGGIGREIGRLCRGIGMELQVISRKLVSENVSFSGNLDSLDRVLQSSDFVFISLPLNRYTKNLITSDKLKKMKKDAILVNVARAAIINEQDLYNHLRENPEFKAGIDVWWQEPITTGEYEMKYPFLDLPNVIGSPHNSGIVPDIDINAFMSALKNVELWMKTGKPHNVVRREDYT